MSSSRRIVITGVGLVTPIGCGDGGFVFGRLVKGVSGVRPLSPSLAQTLSPSCNVSVAATVPHGEAEGEFNESLYRAIERETSPFIRYALHASHLAMQHAQLANKDTLRTHYHPELCGVAIGNGGIGSLAEISSAHTLLPTHYRRLSPYFVPKILVNMPAGHVSMRYGLRGPCHSVATACAAGSHSIGDAFNFIRLGYADMMLAGGADCSLDALSLSGFARMKALSTDAEITCSRPFDQRRSGFVMGEGAGMLVLEELSSARKRGAPILAEILGYGLSGDAHHSTSPSPEGDGAFQSMRTALRVAGVPAREVQYFNAHATSTPMGDGIEIRAIARLLEEEEGQTTQTTQTEKEREPVYVSSTKGSTGHLLGAAGAVETAFTALALHTNIVPPTLNLQEIDEELARPHLFAHVPQKALHYGSGREISSTDDALHSTASSTGEKTLKYAMKNSFGFGGTNASLLLGRYEEDK